MSHASPFSMQFSAIGGPEVLQPVEHSRPVPGPGEVLIAQQAIGLNFIDVYHRSGAYPLPLPGIPGVEGAGVVEAVGEGVETVAVGRRVAYAGAVGAYATHRLLPAWRAIPLPDALAFEDAGSNLLRGLTAHMLLSHVHPLRPGMRALVHAAAGGLGSILVRLAKRLGAEVIATVGHADKAAMARAHGADHVIIGRDIDLAAEVAALTAGEGVHLAIDGIGGSTLARTIACVRPFGMTASIGQVAGVAPPVPLAALRSNALSRPSVMAFSANREAYGPAVEAVLALMQQGLFDRPQQVYALADAASAHADLEAGRIVGSAWLRP
ncbi:quinone oxidoreductase [Rhizobium sp. CSW-27]|uniref:quinone oxidoreductase family protein n=1 Tax=Rhizobium sp. CSW-27 TaxID=2839985 RepID=UPI001C018AED|nr:quinone oxidoreductase [Rhizobium sp. CSW-27]MBT9372686.1 quinone oxidoreductase [Rhizobium sp. CSW-27]